MSSTLLTASAVLTASSAVYLYYCHHRLASRIHHASHSGTLPPSTSETITSIPKEIYTEEYYTIYDHASRSVPRRLLPNIEPAELLTHLVRRNMSTFARLPQAWTMWMITPFAQRNSFRTSHISSLDFKEGDILCGLYRVVVRTEKSIEFEFMHPAPAKGRLVISFREQDGSLIFASETVMWKAKDDKTVIHLERPGLKFMHEMTAWWLLVSGVRYLMDLEVDRVD